MSRTARIKRASRAVRVGPASCGQGVFARGRFRAGEIVAAIQGEIIAEQDYWTAYCIDLGGGEVLEPSAPFRFLNHSCQPNCTLVSSSVWDDATGELRHATKLKAIVAIDPGEQLTIDYAWPPVCAIPCLCGSDNCRGWIVAEDQLDRVNHFQENN
jgi:SET domain-containing protein